MREININEIVQKYLDIFEHPINGNQMNDELQKIYFDFSTNYNASTDKNLTEILEALLDIMKDKTDSNEIREIKEGIYCIQKEISKNNKLLKKINQSDVNSKFNNLVSTGANIATIAEFVKGLLMLL